MPAANPRRALLGALLVAAPLAAGELPYVEVAIPMRDGAELAADLWLPGPGSWPTILIQTPYGKWINRLGGLPLATSDYAFVIVDWRGRWASSGAPDGSTPGQDGFDCVEWIAAQPWSNGAVGTYGDSALGIAQFNTAAEQPPHLLAAVPGFTDPVTDYEQYFPGGALKQEYADFLDNFGFFSESLLTAHPSHDWFWALGEALSDRYDQIAVPMLLVGGWYDLDTRGLLEAWEGLTTASDPAVRGEHRLLVGPWTHAHENELAQGELEYPAAVGVAEAEALAFLDQRLRGLGDGPGGRRIHWFEMGADIWRESQCWLPADVGDRSLWLEADGSLGTQDPSPGAPLVFASDPADPSPTWGGPRLTLANVVEGPADLRAEVESREDLLVLTSDELAEPWTLLGAPHALLDVAFDRTDGDVVARLADVWPDGRSIYVTQGIRRGRFRAGFESENAMTPAVPAAFDIELAPVAITFAPGHRIRLDISSASSPWYHVNPNDGGPLYADSPTTLPLVTSIGVDDSRLVLPTRDPLSLFADGFECGLASWSAAVP